MIKAYVMMVAMGLIWNSNCLISASLLLTQYDPKVFKLTFDIPVPTPKFQLFLNNIYLLEYTFLAEYNVSSTFLFNASLPAGVVPSTSMETYNLIFNNPLDIGGPDAEILNIQSFLLTANKSLMVVPVSPAFGTTIAVGCYLTAYFSILGQLYIEIAQVYVLFVFGSITKTTIYAPIAKYLMMLLPISEIQTQNYQIQESYVFTNMIIPIMLVGLSWLFGFIAKKICKGRESVLSNITYSFFSFGFFHSIGNLFIFVIFFNSIAAITYFQNNVVINFSLSSKIILIFLIYFGFQTVIFYIYMVWRALNPQFMSNQKMMKRYIDSMEYKQCKKLHDGLHRSVWYKRNAIFLTLIKRCILAVLFFTTNVIIYIVLVVQFIHILFIFTAKPFRQAFFYNAVIFFRIIIFIYYCTVALGILYTRIDPILLNYSATVSFISFRAAIVMLCQLGIFIMISYEFYQKCSNLNYQIKLVKEENAFKLKITERIRTNSELTRTRAESIYNDDIGEFTKKDSFSTVDGKLSLKTSQQLGGKKIKKSKYRMMEDGQLPIPRSPLAKLKRTQSKISQKAQKSTNTKKPPGPEIQMSVLSKIPLLKKETIKEQDSPTKPIKKKSKLNHQ